MDNLLAQAIILALLLLSLIGIVKANTITGILLSVLLNIFTAYLIVYVYWLINYIHIALNI